MLNSVFCFIRGSAKAIAAFAAAPVAAFLIRRGLELEPGFELALAGFIAAVIVYLVPNRGPCA